MLVLEASWSGGRSPLNALPKTQVFRFSEQESQLLDQIEELAGETPAMLMIDTKAFAALLPTLAVWFGGADGWRYAVALTGAASLAYRPGRAEIHRQHDVFYRSKSGNQMVGLKHKPELLAPKPGHFIFAELRNVLSIEYDAAGSGPVQSGH